MPKQAYCVCSMTSAWPHYVTHWQSLKLAVDPSDIHLVLDESQGRLTKEQGRGQFPNPFSYSEKKLCKDLDFYHQPSKFHFWNGHGNRNIIWFYAALRMMHFYRSYPNYDYYWFFDDDTKVSDWPVFFKGFEKAEHDFLAYYLFKNLGVLTQPDVPHVSQGMHSFHHDKYTWFGRFPGHEDMLPPGCDNLFGSFFALVRYSKLAMERLMEWHNQGFYGYSEGFVPTVLAATSLELGSVFRPDNTSPYFGPEVEVSHKNTKVTWSWL